MTSNSDTSVALSGKHYSVCRRESKLAKRNQSRQNGHIWNVIGWQSPSDCVRGILGHFKSFGLFAQD